ncbi:hypothetical protein H6P81_009723 [Aristolochia fimbriata]|uniref:NAD-dependent epimerase/dehydratase domain-containing protein n=1 Tax=Aristolochia fimbriata TaxID=158543 RepID=A0AAV7ELU0_ARIFI|nr:hypothetical protein H6P81_009723 [Aristolochia fimbriata]
MEICMISGQCPGPCVFPPTFDAHRQLKLRQFCCCYSSDGKTHSSPVASRMFIFGVGFVGKFFAAELKMEGWDISGTCTSVSKKKELQHMGLETFLFNAEDHDLNCLPRLQDTSHLLISIPPISGLGDPLLGLYRDLLRSKLSNGKLQWLSYLSTTSVYGDTGGAWVDENCPVKASSESAKARLVAEEGWLELGRALGVPAYVFRLGGIYGPGRSAVDTIIKQQTLTKNQRNRESTKFTSRVHVADICQVLKACINKPSLSGGVYNVVDDDPTPRVEVFEFAREMLKEKWPGEMAKSLPSPVTDFIHKKDDYKGEKRVSNALMKRELGIKLLHPTYRSGLRSIAESLHNPFP